MTSLLLEPLPRLSDHERGPKLDVAVDLVANQVGPAGQAENYGAQLLHCHFPVPRNKGIVEWTDGDVLRTRLVPLEETVGLAPSVVAFTSAGEPVTTQWSEDVRASSNEVDPYLRELGRFLAHRRDTTRDFTFFNALSGSMNDSIGFCEYSHMGPVLNTTLGAGINEKRIAGRRLSIKCELLKLETMPIGGRPVLYANPHHFADTCYN